MDATTDIVAAVASRARTVLDRCRCESPLLVRVADDRGAALHLLLVGGSAGPLGGDRLRLRLTVADGARVVVRSVAAAMAQPGPTGARSKLAIELQVGEEAMLDWRPQPMVSVAGSDHRTELRLDAAASATVVVAEGVSLGRSGEVSGRLAVRQRIVLGDTLVLDHENVFGPGELSGPGANGPHRRAGSELFIGETPPGPAVEVTPSCLRATFRPADRVALTTWAHTR